MPTISISQQALDRMSLEELQALASRVGVGYCDIGDYVLRERLKRAGELVT
jgi:hypothetical protein